MLCKQCNNITLDGSCCSKGTHTIKKMRLSSDIEQNFVSYEQKANTSQLSCPKCNSRQIQIKTFQNRSADESVTMNILCLDCGHKESGQSITIK